MCVNLYIYIFYIHTHSLTHTQHSRKRARTHAHAHTRAEEAVRVGNKRAFWKMGVDGWHLSANKKQRLRQQASEGLRHKAHKRHQDLRVQLTGPDWRGGDWGGWHEKSFCWSGSLFTGREVCWSGTACWTQRESMWNRCVVHSQLWHRDRKVPWRRPVRAKRSIDPQLTPLSQLPFCLCDV